MKSPPSALDEVIFNFLFPTANKQQAGMGNQVGHQTGVDNLFCGRARGQVSGPRGTCSFEARVKNSKA